LLRFNLLHFNLLRFISICFVLFQFALLTNTNTVTGTDTAIIVVVVACCDKLVEFLVGFPKGPEGAVKSVVRIPQFRRDENALLLGIVVVVVVAAVIVCFLVVVVIPIVVAQSPSDLVLAFQFASFRFNLLRFVSICFVSFQFASFCFNLLRFNLLQCSSVDAFPSAERMQPLLCCVVLRCGSFCCCCRYPLPLSLLSRACHAMPLAFPGRRFSPPFVKDAEPAYTSSTRR
jgi:hypothetical protein